MPCWDHNAMNNPPFRRVIALWPQAVYPLGLCPKPPASGRGAEAPLWSLGPLLGSYAKLCVLGPASRPHNTPLLRLGASNTAFRPQNSTFSGLEGQRQVLPRSVLTEKMEKIIETDYRNKHKTGCRLPSQDDAERG